MIKNLIILWDKFTLKEHFSIKGVEDCYTCYDAAFIRHKITGQALTHIKYGVIKKAS